MLTHVTRLLFTSSTRLVDSFSIKLQEINPPLLSTMIAALLLSLPLFFWSSVASECTQAEATTAALVWGRAAASMACAPYVVQTSPVSVKAPCTASGCVSIVENLAGELPNCTSSGLNHKVEVLNALQACNIGNTTDADSSKAASDLSPTIDSKSPGISKSPAVSPSKPTPASMLQSSKCTSAENKRLWYLYVTIATSEECAAESIINGGNIEILAPCDSSCTKAIKSLAGVMPDCIYDNKDLNMKRDVVKQLYECGRNGSSISTALVPDNAGIFSSSSGTNALQISEHTSESNLVNSPSDNTLESSNVENTSNAALSCKGKVRHWILLSAAIVVNVMVFL